MDQPIDCQKTPICYECNYRYPNYQNAWNDPNLSTEAKLFWTLLSEWDNGFDLEEYEEVCEQDEIYGPFMELVRKGYFHQSK